MEQRKTMGKDGGMGTEVQSRGDWRPTRTTCGPYGNGVPATYTTKEMNLERGPPRVNQGRRKSRNESIVEELVRLVRTIRGYPGRGKV